jgi:hypothetical protein
MAIKTREVRNRFKRGDKGGNAVQKRQKKREKTNSPPRYALNLLNSQPNSGTPITLQNICAEMGGRMEAVRRKR